MTELQRLHDTDCTLLMGVLNITEDSPYRCLAVAIVPEDYKKTTINLRCPIIINTNERRAAQVILSSRLRSTRRSDHARSYKKA